MAVHPGLLLPSITQVHIIYIYIYTQTKVSHLSGDTHPLSERDTVQ
jgi:hypothetical protein